MHAPLKHRLTTAFALMLCSVTVANATVQDLGTLSTGTTSFSSSESAKFTDTWNFALGSASALSGSASALGLKGFSVDLFSEVVGNKGKIKDVLLVSATSFSFADLAAGNYFLRIQGSLAKKDIAGSYSGNLNVAAVPEPEVWAMMLIGVGLVGFQLRRKSKAGPVKITA